MKKILLLCLILVVFLTSCTKDEVPVELCPENVTKIEIWPEGNPNTPKVIDRSDDIKTFCEKFNSINFHRVVLFAKDPVDMAGCLYKIVITYADKSVDYITGLSYKRIKINGTKYEAYGQLLRDLVS